MVWLSVLLVTLCAVSWDAGVVLQKRAADSLPPLVLGSGLGRTVLRFVKSPGWMGGMIISALGWGLFAAALSFTPVSLARSIQGSGFVVLAFMSVFFLNHRLTALEWAGVAAVTLGVLLLGTSEPTNQPVQNALNLTHLFIGLGTAVGASVLWVLISRVTGLADSGVSIAAVSGVLLGLGDVLTRALMVEADKSLVFALGVLGPLLATTYIAGFLMLSRSYQKGRAIVATGASDLSARLVTLFVGVLALDEALPLDPRLRVERIFGFGLILMGTVTLAHFSAEELASRSANPAASSVASSGE